MFGKAFQRRYALTDQGVKNAKKGAFWTVIVNLVVMGGMGILYLMMVKYMDTLTQGAPLPHAWIYILLVLAFVVLSLATHIQQYKATYGLVYGEVKATRLSLAERLRKLPLGYFGKRDLADLTETIMGDVGCLCYGGGDWLMMYGNPAYHGTLSWLTEGVAAIPQWRYNLAMALAFPGIILYGIALFAVEGYIKDGKQRKVYHYLNAFGLTPWIALHLFYVMILTLFSWMHGNGYADSALAVCEGLFSRLSWLVPVSEGLMLPVFLYWFWLQISGKTVFPRWIAFTNVLVIYVVLKGVSLLLPVSAFRLGFTNGLMSESMVLWFGIMLLWERRRAAV